MTFLFNSCNGTSNADLQWWQKPRRSQNKQRTDEARQRKPGEASKDSALLRSLLLPLLLWRRELFPQSGLHLCPLWTPSTLTTAGIVLTQLLKTATPRIILSLGSILDYHICRRILDGTFLRYLQEFGLWIICSSYFFCLQELHFLAVCLQPLSFLPQTLGEKEHLYMICCSTHDQVKM